MAKVWAISGVILAPLYLLASTFLGPPWRQMQGLLQLIFLTCLSTSDVTFKPLALS